jgi:hypothetical protein
MITDDPFLPNSAGGIDRTTKEIVSKIATADFGFVRERILMERTLTSEEWIRGELEFRRFLALVAIENKPLAVIGPKIDAIWHQFILFTKQYQRFCRNVFGRMIEHQPHTSLTPVPAVALSNFFAAYRRHFGHIPSIWFSGVSRNARKALRKLESVVSNNAEEDVIAAQSLNAAKILRWSGWNDPK